MGFIGASTFPGRTVHTFVYGITVRRPDDLEANLRSELATFGADHRRHANLDAGPPTAVWAAIDRPGHEGPGGATRFLLTSLKLRIDRPTTGSAGIHQDYISFTITLFDPASSSMSVQDRGPVREWVLAALAGAWRTASRDGAMRALTGAAVVTAWFFGSPAQAFRVNAAGVVEPFVMPASFQQDAYVDPAEG